MEFCKYFFLYSIVSKDNLQQEAYMNPLTCTFLHPVGIQEMNELRILNFTPAQLSSLCSIINVGLNLGGF